MGELYDDVDLKGEHTEEVWVIICLCIYLYTDHIQRCISVLIENVDLHE